MGLSNFWIDYFLKLLPMMYNPKFFKNMHKNINVPNHVIEIETHRKYVSILNMYHTWSWKGCSWKSVLSRNKLKSLYSRISVITEEAAITFINKSHAETLKRLIRNIINHRRMKNIWIVLKIMLAIVSILLIFIAEIVTVFMSLWYSSN